MNGQIQIKINVFTSAIHVLLLSCVKKLIYLFIHPLQLYLQRRGAGGTLHRNRSKGSEPISTVRRQANSSQKDNLTEVGHECKTTHDNSLTP